MVPWVRGHDRGELGEASFRGEGAAAACITMQAADTPGADEIAAEESYDERKEGTKSMKIPTTMRGEEPWLELVRREVRTFRFGVIELAVVDGEVTRVGTEVRRRYKGPEFTVVAGEREPGRGVRNR